ncbi:DNA-binding protein [Mycolicibacterium pulveris]|uniref:DNA-binding protein n=1 Tax=Mycolicibacterium pulveris TaxID=36813 RepID=A0A7I7UBW0_MYCPV|nr:helix-turn-helix domain-containing protein [Mycolicibacterium pulveris]MCV6982118.1 DNA-binding protein [Mycolicibacterium pulveris]BBY78928.1 hypothetical protein MPUL_00860 [Mycolicibacterium pulveris]
MTTTAAEPPPRRWAKKPDAAAYVDVYPETIDNWVERGLIRAYKFGPRLVRYDLNEIDAMGAAATAQEAANG